MSEHDERNARLSELTRIARERTLTPDEERERAALRELFLQNFRKNFKNQLENTVVQQDDGTKVPLKDWPRTVEADAKAAFEGQQSPD